MNPPPPALTHEDFAIFYRFAVALTGSNSDTESLVHDALEEKARGLSVDMSPEDRRAIILTQLWKNRPIPLEDAPVSNLPPAFHRINAENRAVLALRGLGLENHLAQIIGITSFDDSTSTPEKISTALDSIPVSPELINRLRATIHTAAVPFRIRSIIGLTILFSALVFVAVGFWIWHDATSKFDEDFAKRFSAALEKFPTDTLDPIDLPIRELPDFLFLSQDIENTVVPTDFANVSSSSAGLLQVEGHPVILIHLKNSAAFLLLFRTEDFALDPNQPSWKTASLEKWNAALRTQHGQGNLILTSDDIDTLQAIIPK